MDPRFPERREEEGGFGFARASSGPGVPGWAKIGTAWKYGFTTCVRRREEQGPSEPWEPQHLLHTVHTLLLLATHSRNIPVPRPEGIFALGIASTPFFKAFPKISNQLELV